MKYISSFTKILVSMNSLSVFSVAFVICFFTKTMPVMFGNEYLTGLISLNRGRNDNFAADDGREGIGAGRKRIWGGSSTSCSSTHVDGKLIVSAHHAQYKTGAQRLFQVCGDRNIIETVVIAMITLVTFKLWLLWDDNFMKEEFLRRFSLAEITAATQNFNRELLIGEGGFGKVYKGIINNGKETVAIKILKYSSNQGAHEFSTEINALSKLRHVNLVSLIGYCNEQLEMILVYEYMIHGTLRNHIYKKKKNFPSWNRCLEICVGAARGLNYLHTQCKIIHRDVKTSNILLDKNFVAKFSDFGLAKLQNICEAQSHISTGVKGTPGYIDPHYEKSGKLKPASDVYAFGVVLLEVLCGRPARDGRLKKYQGSRPLVTWALENISKGDAENIVDSNLSGQIMPDSLKIFVKVAESCLDEEPDKRPTMIQVVSQLERALELQEKPSKEEDSKESTSGTNHYFPSDKFVVIRQLDRTTIEAATDGFSVSNFIGRGRYGPIYKVEMRNGQVLAVQRIASVVSYVVTDLSAIKHPNIMNVSGNFLYGAECILVYEYFREDRSLHAILHGTYQLPWSTLVKIIIGIARGIHFLEVGFVSILSEIYCNIDPYNVFLDADMNPKIAIDSGSVKTSCYAPPEGYCVGSKRKSDIYGFGILVLDVLSMGKLSKQSDLVTFVRRLRREGRVLEVVAESMTDANFSSPEAKMLIETALSCTQDDQRERPSIRKVMQVLKGDSELDSTSLVNRQWSPGLTLARSQLDRLRWTND